MILRSRKKGFASFVFALFLGIELLVASVEKARCPLEDGNEVAIMLTEDWTPERIDGLLLTQACKDYVGGICDAPDKINRVNKSLCYLQFAEKCACGNTTSADTWMEELYSCPEKLLRMETPICLKTKVCRAPDSDLKRKKNLPLCQEKSNDEVGKLKREKRQEPKRKLTCDSFITARGSSYSADSLSYIDASVFRDCPGSLNSPNYTMDQLKAVAGQAIEAFGDPCRWTSDQVQNLTIVVIGLGEAQLNCIPFSDAAVVTSVGKSLYYVPSSSAKIEQLYYRWKVGASVRSLSSKNVALLQGLTCGVTSADLDAMMLSEFGKSIPVMSQYNCFKSSELPRLYNLTCTVYEASGSSWNASNVRAAGTMIAGAPPAVFIKFNMEKLSAISPLVFAVLGTDVISALSSEQTSSLTLDQLRAIPQVVLVNLTAERRNLILSLTFNQTRSTETSSRNPRASSYAGTSATPPHPPHEKVSNITPPDEKVSNVSPTDEKVSRVSPTVDSTDPAPADPEGNTGIPPDAAPSDAPYEYPNDGEGEPPNLEGTPHPVGPTEPGADGGGGGGEGEGGSHDRITTVGQNPSGAGNDHLSTRGSNDLATRAVPEGQESVTLPPVIDSSNIGPFLMDIGSKLTTEDVQRIDPMALASPQVLKALASNEMDTSMRSALTQKLDETLSKVSEFDPGLFVAGQDLIPTKRYKDLNNSQLEMILRNPDYEPNLRLSPVIGPEVAEILAADPSKINALKKSLISVPMVDFGSIINRQKITKDFFPSIRGSLLTHKQSRDLYGSYLSDSEVDLKSMSPDAVSQLLLHLPDSLAPAVRSEDVRTLNPEEAEALLKAVYRALDAVIRLDNPDNLDLGSSGQPLPLEYELYERMKNQSLPPVDKLSFLLTRQLLTVKAIMDLKTDSCQIFSYGIYTGNDPILVSSAYDVCSAALADRCRTLLTSPAGFVTPSELGALDAQLTSLLCLMQIGPEVASISESLMQINVDVLESLAGKRPDLLLSRRVTALLPRIDIGFLEMINDSASVLRLCKEMACEAPGSIPAGVIREKFQFCVRNKVPLRQLTCAGEDLSLFLSTVGKDFIQTNLTCDQIVPAVDVLQSSVIDCPARGAIYECLKNLDFANFNAVVRLGSLIDQMSDEEFGKIPRKFLCDYTPVLSGLHGLWDEISSGRVDAGFKALDLCKRETTYKRLMEVRSSPECTGVPASSRRKRETAASGKSCSVAQLSNSVASAMTAAQLGSLTKEDFVNCVNVLGRVKGFSGEQWAALAGLAKTVYGSDVSRWTAENIISSAGIVTGLSSSEVSALVLNQIEPVYAIGSNGLWDDDKLSSAFGSVKSHLFNGNVTHVQTAQLRSMGEVVCGATVADMSALPGSVVCESLQELGRVKECAENQLSEFVKAVKDPGCLGATVSSWAPSSVYALGSLIGGLTKDDLGQLTKDQIRFISPASIAAIPPMQFNGFTAEQLQLLSLDQAARITSGQLRSLDPTKQKVLESKLAPIRSEITLALSGNGQGHVMGSSVVMLASALFLLSGPLL